MLFWGVEYPFNLWHLKWRPDICWPKNSQNLTLITSAISLHFPFLWSHLWWSHFRLALPVGYFHVPLTWFSIPLLCMFDLFFCGSNSCLRSSIYFFARFDWYWCSWIYFLCVSLYLYAVSIHFCEVRFICVRFDLFLCRFDSIFVWFDSFFGPFDLFFAWFDSFFCCFDILWPIFVLFVCVFILFILDLKILSVTERHRKGLTAFVEIFLFHCPTFY